MVAAGESLNWLSDPEVEKVFLVTERRDEEDPVSPYRLTRDGREIYRLAYQSSVQNSVGCFIIRVVVDQSSYEFDNNGEKFCKPTLGLWVSPEAGVRVLESSVKGENDRGQNRVVGRIAVYNAAIHKDVNVVYTFDGWKTRHESKAGFTQDPFPYDYAYHNSSFHGSKPRFGDLAFMFPIMFRTWNTLLATKWMGRPTTIPILVSHFVTMNQKYNRMRIRTSEDWTAKAGPCDLCQDQWEAHSRLLRRTFPSSLMPMVTGSTILVISMGTVSPIGRDLTFRWILETTLFGST